MSQPTVGPSCSGGSRTVPPTLATVADEAGVSRQTVSNALNNPDLLRPDTLERVQSVIERLGYSPNRAARQLRTRSSHLIGLRFEAAQEGTSNALMDRFLHSLVEAASRTGHHVLLFSGDPDDPLDGYDDLLRSTAVDAFVVTDTYAGTPQAGFLEERGAPFVAFGRPVGRPGRRPRRGSTSTAPTVPGSRPSTCSSRGTSGSPGSAGRSPPASARTGARGWETAMRAAGQDTRGLGVRLTDNVDAARMATHDLLRGPVDHRLRRAPATPSPSACCTRARSAACEPGRDVGVVGFDDSLAAQVTWPGLTSVRQPLEQVAVELVRILHTVLAHKPLSDKGRMLQPELVVRRSSRRAS